MSIQYYKGKMINRHCKLSFIIVLIASKRQARASIIDLYTLVRLLIEKYCTTCT